MYEVAFTGDADETSEDAVDDHEDVEFPVAGVEGVEDGKDAARARRHQRRAGGLGRKDPQPTRYSWQGKVLYYALPPEHTVCTFECLTEGAAGVEGEPAPPEHEEADDGVGGAPHRRVALDVEATQARSHHLGRSKCWKCCLNRTHKLIEKVNEKLEQGSYPMPLRRDEQHHSQRCRTHPSSCTTVHVVSLVSVSEKPKSSNPHIRSYC